MLPGTKAFGSMAEEDSDRVWQWFLLNHDSQLELSPDCDLCLPKLMLRRMNYMECYPEIADKIRTPQATYCQTICSTINKPDRTWS